MAMQQNAPQTIRGEVEAVNEKGVRIGGAWYNFSRYHSVPSPYRDELVELTVLEGEPWIERLVVLEDSKGCTVTRQPNPDPAPDMPCVGPQQPVAPRSCRDRLHCASDGAQVRRDARRGQARRVLGRRAQGRRALRGVGARGGRR